MLEGYGRFVPEIILVLVKQSPKQHHIPLGQGRGIPHLDRQGMWIPFLSVLLKPLTFSSSVDSMRICFQMKIMNLIPGCAKMGAKFG